MYDRIVVPLDGSERAEAALPFAALILSRRVRLLIVEPVVLAAALPRAAMAPLPPWDSWRRLSPTLYLEAVAAPFRRQGRAVEPVIEAGVPGERIVAAAADADLVVLTTRGRGALQRALLGSVADHVVRHAPAPTLLVRERRQPAAVVARIVAPLDGSARAEAALPVAARLADLLGVRFHLVQVVDAATRLATAKDLEREAATYLDGQVQRLAAADVVASSEVLAGPPARTLLEMIGATDLVAMTPRGRGALSRALLGSVAERLVREAAGPVLLVRDDRQAMRDDG